MGNSALQRARRAEILAEVRRYDSAFGRCKGGQQDDQNKQDGILQIPRRPVDLLWHIVLVKRDLIKEILYQPKRAKKSADEPSQQYTEKHHQPQHIERKVMLYTKRSLQ